MKFTTVFTVLIFFLLFSSCEKENFSALNQLDSYSDREVRDSWLELPDNFQDFVEASFSKRHPLHPANYENARIDLIYWDEFVKVDPAPHQIAVDDRLMRSSRGGFQVIAQHGELVAETNTEEQVCPYSDCDTMLQEAVAHYQQLANETSQIVYGGLSCCHPQYGVLHYIILVQPQHLVPPTGPVNWTHAPE